MGNSTSLDGLGIHRPKPADGTEGNLWGVVDTAGCSSGGRQRPVPVFPTPHFVRSHFAGSDRSRDLLAKPLELEDLGRRFRHADGGSIRER